MKLLDITLLYKKVCVYFEDYHSLLERAAHGELERFPLAGIFISAFAVVASDIFTMSMGPEQ